MTNPTAREQIIATMEIGDEVPDSMPERSSSMLNAIDVEAITQAAEKAQATVMEANLAYDKYIFFLEGRNTQLEDENRALKAQVQQGEK